MSHIDLKDPSPMNRFYGIDTPEEALKIVDGLLAGETFPEVTYWRLRSYVEMAETYGRWLAEGKIKRKS